MKKALLLIAAVVFAFAACAPDKYSLGEESLTSGDLVEGIAYSITHDASNPNTIILTSLLDTKYQALWEHPQGRSQGSPITINMPFAGEYEVTFGVMTSAGVVYGEPTTFTVEDFCSDFVSDELWTYLTGGVGNSKKWYFDIDADGVSRYFAGPVTFYGTDDSWETVSGGVTLDTSIYDSWSWAADYSSVAGWQFSSTLMDFGYMEFDLNGGSNVTTVMYDLDKTLSGSFMLDTDNHTIKFTDCELLHESTNDSQVESWSGTMKLLALTENYMQIGVLRTSDACLLSFNYISEEYRDSWSPAASTEEVLPELADDWRDYIEQKTNKVITYKLSEDNPYDYAELDGTLKGVSVSAADAASEISLEINCGTSEYTFTNADGDSETGSYSLSDDGLFTFTPAFTPVVISADGDVAFQCSDESTLRILSMDIDDYTGAVSELWVGCPVYDDFGNAYEYVAYCLVPQVEGASDSIRYAASLNYFTTNWAFLYGSTVYITGDGSYTLTVEGCYNTDGGDGVDDTASPYGIYLDVLKILKKYPNMDMTITDIQIDGVSIEFDDSIIDRGVGDAETTARRYVLNPWGATADDYVNYYFNSSLAVTIQVTMETGTPFGE